MTKNESKVIWKTLVLEGEKTNYSVSSNGLSGMIRVEKF